MAEYRFEKVTRTAYSEAYAVFDENDVYIGRLDIHWKGDDVSGSLVIPESWDDDEVKGLLNRIDLVVLEEDGKGSIGVFRGYFDDDLCRYGPRGFGDAPSRNGHEEEGRDAGSSNQ